MLKYWISFILFIYISSVTSQSLSFTQAYELMNKENSLLKAGKKGEDEYFYEIRKNRGLRYPSVSIFGAGLYSYKNFGADLNGARDMLGGLLHVPDPSLLGDWNIDILKRDILLAGVNVFWPIFTGGKINAANNASKIQWEISKKETNSIQHKLVSELVQRYFQLKLAQEALKIRNQTFEVMKKHQYDSKRLEEEGMIASVERMQADVAVSESNRQLLASQKDLTLAILALNNTLENPTEYKELSTDFFTINTLKSLEYYQESALKNYPELQKVQLQLDLLDQQIKAKNSTYFPELIAFGTALPVTNHPIRIGDHEMPWIVGLGLNYTLFEGAKNKNEIKSIKAKKESVELRHKKAEIDIKTKIASIYLNIQKEREQMDNLKTQFAQAEELLRVRMRAFSEGLATSTDVIDAELNYSATHLYYIQTQYNYLVELSKLLEYSGLNEEFLGNVENVEKKS